jgi:hypothetical protein
MDTIVKHPAMVYVLESYLRENVFDNSFPRNAYKSQYCLHAKSIIYES